MARADGRDFPDRDLEALAALRAAPHVLAAGPLLRGTDDNLGHSLIGHVVDLPRGTTPPGALRVYLWALGLTVDASPSGDSIALPASMGLRALDLANQMAGLAPKLGLYLRGDPVSRICYDR